MTPFAALQACAVFASAAAAVMMLAVAPGEPASQDTEQVRLRSHFDSVLVELSTAPTTALSDQQRQRRLQLIQRLAAYRDSGWFPHNTTHPQVQLPVFRDTQGGVMCDG